MQDELNERLSRIVTDWGVLHQAHGRADAARAAQELVILRYGPAIRRYLLRWRGMPRPPMNCSRSSASQ